MGVCSEAHLAKLNVQVTLAPPRPPSRGQSHLEETHSGRRYIVVVYIPLIVGDWRALIRGGVCPEGCMPNDLKLESDCAGAVVHVGAIV